MFRPRPRSRRFNIGRTRWKLWEMLVKAGFTIPAADCLWMQEGAYRSRYWDLARWGCQWKDDKGYYTIYSWDTMTECVKYGIEFTTYPLGESEISSKKPPVAVKRLNGQHTGD